MQSERRVWIVQCLCPQRHCIVAVADEATNEAEAFPLIATLRDRVAALIADKMINPWCELCQAPRERWQFELARTRFATIAEAGPELAKAEADQRASAALLRAMGAGGRLH